MKLAFLNLFLLLSLYVQSFSISTSSREIASENIKCKNLLSECIYLVE